MYEKFYGFTEEPFNSALDQKSNSDNLLLLNVHETALYIEKCLNVACAAQSPFTTEAIEAIYRYSRGIPRLINPLCDLALFLGFSQRQLEIGRDLIIQAAGSLSLQPLAEESDDYVEHEQTGEPMPPRVIMPAGEERTQDLPNVSNLRSVEEPNELSAGGRGWRHLVYVSIAVCATFVVALGFVVGRRSDTGSMPWPDASDNLSASQPQAVLPPPPSPSAPAALEEKATAVSSEELAATAANPDDPIAAVASQLKAVLPPPPAPSAPAPDDPSDSSNAQPHPSLHYVDKIVVVRKGETLEKIIKQEYGRFDTRILSLIYKVNPDIPDSSVIEVGQRIILPTLPN